MINQLPNQTCITEASLIAALNQVDTQSQVDAFKKIQMYVLVTILVLLLQLGHLMKPFAYGFFRLLSWLSYLMVPVLISYILGLMGRPVAGYGMVEYHTVGTFRYLTCVWVIFLLFAYAGFDNLNAFSLEETHDRSKLILQICIRFSLLLLILHQLPPETNVIPISCAFFVLTCKFVGRLLALAHSAGATPRIKKEVTRIINHMNQQAEEDAAVDPVTMPGFSYLVGPKFSKVEEEKVVSRITDGITMKKIWVDEVKFFGLENKELKDMCLSFSLFWLLLGKFWSYPLYSNPSARANAWRMVRHGLLGKKGEHERVFRVIEIELAFLRDYFHAKYIFFYLNGYYWKFISIVALPAMFWWFIQKAIDYQELDKLTNQGYGHFTFTRVANTIVISVIVALEAMQLGVFLTSRWLKVTLCCLCMKKITPENTGRLFLFILGMFRSIFLGKSRSSNKGRWRTPWKRGLDQFSLVRSCSTVPWSANHLKLQFISIAGIPLTKPGRKKDKRIALSDQVKESVVLCLQRYDTCPKLSNGVDSLSRNGVMDVLPEWASKLKNDTETILVWHVATSVCELYHDRDTRSQLANDGNMKVALDLSKYCAYLLFFAPSLLPLPSLEAETMCETVVKEVIYSFKEQINGCGKGANADKYEKLMELINEDEEAGDQGIDMSVLKKGAKLGSELVTWVGDEKKRWKILADFWAEMILYLAPSDNNEKAHAEKLSQGGEFITHLWALLIHAGITNRKDMDVTSIKRKMNIDQEQQR